MRSEHRFRPTNWLVFHSIASTQRQISLPRDVCKLDFFSSVQLSMLSPLLLCVHRQMLMTLVVVHRVVFDAAYCSFFFFAVLDFYFCTFIHAFVMVSTSKMFLICSKNRQIFPSESFKTDIIFHIDFHNFLTFSQNFCFIRIPILDKRSFS